jgi:hypothetical protein
VTRLLGSKDGAGHGGVRWRLEMTDGGPSCWTQRPTGQDEAGPMREEKK